MWRNWALAICVGSFAVTAAANEVGHVKVAKGAATVQRGAEKLAAVPGMKIFPADVIMTGKDGASSTFTRNSVPRTPMMLEGV